jgi:CRP/FNR family transcriptional regulator, cyclic AMP receptor protein
MSSNHTERFRSGETIFQEGEYGTKMYVVKEGEVELSVRGKIIGELGTGSILGEMALIDRKPRSASARAKSRCELIPIDQEQFLALVRQNPSFSLDVMRVLAERLRSMDEKV